MPWFGDNSSSDNSSSDNSSSSNNKTSPTFPSRSTLESESVKQQHEDDHKEEEGVEEETPRQNMLRSYCSTTYNNIGGADRRIVACGNSSGGANESPCSNNNNNGGADRRIISCGNSNSGSANEVQMKSIVPTTTTTEVPMDESLLAATARRCGRYYRSSQSPQRRCRL